jgi:hypothetical protein
MTETKEDTEIESAEVAIPEDTPPETDLIATVHTGIRMMDRGVIMAGHALRQLREGPRQYMSQKDWDAWLREEFVISYATAHKWMEIAKFDAEVGPVEDGSFPNGNTVWENLPPRWTSQYEIVSKLEPHQVLGAIQTEMITPLSTGKQIAEAIAQITQTPIESPTAEKYLKRALSALIDARTQYKAGNTESKSGELDIDMLITSVGNELDTLARTVAGLEDDTEPEWKAEVIETETLSIPTAVVKRDFKAEWRAEIDRTYQAASAHTNGVLINTEGNKNNVDPRSLFRGPKARAMKYASDELKDWWLEHPRPLSQAEWIKAQRKESEEVSNSE